jgi:hypothetical protein
MKSKKKTIKIPKTKKKRIWLMDKFVKPVNQITQASTSNPWTELLTPLELKFIF